MEASVKLTLRLLATVFNTEVGLLFMRSGARRLAAASRLAANSFAPNTCRQRARGDANHRFARPALHRLQTSRDD
jgi:hypothetical protein